MVSYVSQPGSLTVPPVRLTYYEVAADLEQRIRSGEYPAGSKLPSYSELGKLYSVSLSSVTRALALLRERGLVSGVHGVGVYVND